MLSSAGLAWLPPWTSCRQGPGAVRRGRHRAGMGGRGTADGQPPGPPDGRSGVARCSL